LIRGRVCLFVVKKNGSWPWLRTRAYKMKVSRGVCPEEGLMSL